MSTSASDVRPALPPRAATAGTITPPAGLDRAQAETRAKALPGGTGVEEARKAAEAATPVDHTAVDRLKEHVRCGRARAGRAPAPPRPTYHPPSEAAKAAAADNLRRWAADNGYPLAASGPA